MESGQRSRSEGDSVVVLYQTFEHRSWCRDSGERFVMDLISSLHDPEAGRKKPERREEANSPIKVIKSSTWQSSNNLGTSRIPSAPTTVGTRSGPLILRTITGGNTSCCAPGASPPFREGWPNEEETITFPVGEGPGNLEGDAKPEDEVKLLECVPDGPASAFASFIGRRCQCRRSGRKTE